MSPCHAPIPYKVIYETVILHHSAQTLTPTMLYNLDQGLRTLNEGINQRRRCGRLTMLYPYLKIWDQDFIFGRAVKAISSPGVRSLCFKIL